MDNAKLKETLQQLHAELEAGGKPDPELKAILQTLAQDIHQALDKTEPSGAAATDTLEDRARAVTAEFAAKHPYLESTLRDLMDGLGKIGI